MMLLGAVVAFLAAVVLAVVAVHVALSLIAAYGLAVVGGVSVVAVFVGVLTAWARLGYLSGY